MNIGIDMRMAGKRHGGIGRYAFEIVKNILELDNENKYVLFFNKKLADAADMHFFERFPNASVVQTTARHYSISEQTSFLRLLNKYELDLAHFPNFNVPIFYKRPFVVTIHDVVHHKIGGAKKTHALHFYAYKKVIELAAAHARSIITVSEFSKRDIREVLHVPNEKVTVIYEGPTLQPVENQEFVNKIKERYILKKPYFLFVGVLERKKNVVQLTRGFDVFMKKYGTDMDLVVVGKADKHYPDIKHHALDIEHHDRLVFTGYIEDDELEALYSGAHSFVNASLYEGFGLPGIEAMQFGTPLIVSNIPVFNEIYDNAAVYFNALDANDIAEKMHLVTRDPQFYEQLKKNSMERGKIFNWKDAAEKTLKIYKNCLDNVTE